MIIRYMIMRSNGDIWNREYKIWAPHEMFKNSIDQITYATEGEARIQQQEHEKLGVDCLVCKTVSFGGDS